MPLLAERKMPPPPRPARAIVFFLVITGPRPHPAAHEQIIIPFFLYPHIRPAPSARAPATPRRPLSEPADRPRLC